MHLSTHTQNILIGPYGEVLLLDWGLAKVWDKDGTNSQLKEAGGQRNFENSSMTGFQKLQGTLFYMSPEQMRKDPAIDRRTDIYSLGVILYEALTGRTPVLGELVDEVIQSTLNDVPPKPSEVADFVPALLEEITMKCLNKSSSERPQSAAALIQVLKQNW